MSGYNNNNIKKIYKIKLYVTQVPTCLMLACRNIDLHKYLFENVNKTKSSNK